MNARNMPGFTAENATFRAGPNYPHGGRFDSQSSSAYVEPAYKNVACAYLWKVAYGFPQSSIEYIVSRTAYNLACG